MTYKTNPDKKTLWQGRIAEWAASKESISFWCRSNNISLSTFQYWRNKLFEPSKKDDTAKAGSFIEILPEEKDEHSGVVIQAGNITVKLSKGFDEDTLFRAITSLKVLS